MLRQLFKKEKKLDVPIVLDQKTSTFEDISLNAELRQRLKHTTIEKNLRYGRFMQRHKIPIEADQQPH